METNIKSITRIATLNVRGINKEVQKDIAALDAHQYNTPILAITETHIPKKEHLEEIHIKRTRNV